MSVPESEQLFIPAQRVRSLCWLGDELVDWVAGGTRYSLDGTRKERYVNYAYSFDGAVVSPTGRFAAIYTRLGTKGLVLDRGEVLREINRSFYHAHVHEYPIVLFQLPDGREVIAHCPEQFNRLEIDDLESGERLTKLDVHQTTGLFHSRLTVNPSTTKLASAGWVWQPLDWAVVYDIENALSNPAMLDPGQSNYLRPWSAVSNLTFFTDHTLLVYSAKEIIEEVEDDEYDRHSIIPDVLSMYDLSSGSLVLELEVEEHIGTMMSVGTEHVFGFYEYPKLVHIPTGTVVQRWPDIKSGTQLSSILWHKELPPPIALDPANRRFAVADEEGIRVIIL